MLDLQWNYIGAVGAQYLARALQVNTVRLDFSPAHRLFTTFISHRHSRLCIFKETTSALQEHSIWQVLYKWTEWDSTSFHFIAHLLSSFHTDTHNARSSKQHDRQCRSTAFGKSIASEHSQTRVPFISSLIYYLHLIQTLTILDLWGNKIGTAGAQHLARALQVNKVRLDLSPSHHSSIIFISHRHLQRWILIGTALAMEERNIWRMRCKWTEWHLTFLYFITHLPFSFHTDTHKFASSTQRYRR